MNVTLEEILALVGRLDAGTGFDAPRERFRRFLIDRVDEPKVARALIEPIQHSFSEQHQRALQDLIVVLGRALGFDTAFSGYPRFAAAVKYDGQWKSRGRLDVAVQVRTDPAPIRDPDELARSLIGATSGRGENDVRHLALCVVTALYGGRARLDDAAGAEKVESDLRIASIRSILWLADMVHAGRMKHLEIVRLLTSGVSLDLVVDVMAQFAAGQHENAAADSRPAPGLPHPSVTPAESFWVTTIERDENVSPEQVVSSVIGRRQILAVREGGPEDFRARAGDWICFSVPRKGIVGHAQVDSIVDGIGLIRGPERFRLVFRLKNVEIYDTPIAFGGTEPIDEVGPRLGSLTREQFAVLTARPRELGSGDLRHTG